VDAYAKLLRTPGVAVLSAAVTLARLPIGIEGLAVVLFVREVTGSFATAGLATGALALGTAVGSPLAARLVDRRGTRMLFPLALVHAVALVSIGVLGDAGAPVITMPVAALIAGSTFPPAGAVLRSMWPKLVSDPPLLRTAYAFDSVTIEIAFVTGPLLTALAVAFAGAELALAISGAIVLLGTLVFLAALPAEAEPAPAHRRARLGPLGPMAAPSVRLIALTTLPIGYCLGTIEVALPAFSSDLGAPALAGIFLALWSLSSGIGGLVFGAREARGGLVDSYLRLAAVLPLACLPLVGATTPWMMLVLVVLAGLPLAPVIASRNQLVGVAAPEGAATESFTWLLTALVAGSAAGAAVTGSLAQADNWRLAVFVGCLVAAAGAITAAWRRPVLDRAVVCD
jgi:MFS family permease